jgi:Rhodopirellula transposase DDE domain
MKKADLIRQIEVKFAALNPVFDERVRRQWAAAEAMAYGWGGVTAVSCATGLSIDTIRKGMVELSLRECEPNEPVLGRVRSPGGGRQRLDELDLELAPALERLVDPATRGDPQSPLRWTCKSTRRLAKEMTQAGHPISAGTVATLLKKQGYSLQGNRKTKEGAQHPDRDAQFEHLNATVKRFEQQGQPVISVDAKKKELVGAFKNGGREWQPKGKPEEVKVHDFVDQELGKAIPYGIYDMTNNEGWVSVGIDHDTAQFAAQAIKRWWQTMGRSRYPHADALLITADGGGSNGSRCRLWKSELQQLANELGLRIHVCHFPPGASKWNKIEHRMFAHITQNWRGRPLISHEVIISLIANTTTRAGLKIRAELDCKSYPTGIKVSDEELADLALERDDFHGEWNYQLLPEELKIY